MRWGVERRLEFIEFRLFWEGAINRSDLVDHFRISVPQASKDLNLYQARAPGNMYYDRKEKRYRAEPEFMLRFLEPDPYVYLSHLRSVTEGTQLLDHVWIGCLPQADVAITPKRDINIEVLRAVLDAMRSERSLEILYQSMNPDRPEPMRRDITPHAFGYDGFRWHVRAYCHIDNAFKDFLLSRILEVGMSDQPGLKGGLDWLWNNYFEIVLGPHPELADSQKVVVACDYGFSEGQGVLSVRYAMLFYVLKNLGLLGHPEKQDARKQHIVVLNKPELEKALIKAEDYDSIILDY